MRIRFLGANGNVTGSRHFVEAGDFRFLVDCGMTQGHDLLSRNWEPCPEPAKDINAVLLTHAHLDHCGLLPKLFLDGFRGKIYGTSATLDLARLILRDSAHIQEEDALFKQKRHAKEKRTPPHPVRPLYTQDDVEKTVALFSVIDYDKETKIAPNISVTLREAGHVLGSSFIEVVADDNGVAKRLLFSGDLGRPDRPILRDPAYFTEPDSPVDALFIESTYGDRCSEPIDEVNDQLAVAIHRAVERRGLILMPVFAVERAQEMIYRFGSLQAEGRMPKDVPIWLDSPMAVEASKIFLRHRECFDEETLRRYESRAEVSNFHFLTTKEQSMTLNDIEGPGLILSSAGMCNAGRIKHHLANHIGFRRNMVLFCGYQAAGTLGRQIVEGNKRVRINGQIVAVKAEVATIRGISGHADQAELLKWVGAIPIPPKNVFVVHGETRSSETFRSLLEKRLSGSRIFRPEYGDEVTL